MNTIRTNLTTATSFKAFAFGVVATVALIAGVSHAETQREQAATVVKLDTVYITGKRVVAQVQTLPTVYITGSRAAQRGRDETLAANTASCASQLC